MEENGKSAIAENGESQESTPVEPQAPTPEAEERLAQENGELKDRLLRLQAEFENFRKRTERERLEFFEYAGEQIVRSLLPILDDFERAMKASDVSGEGTEFVKGIQLIYARLLDTLQKQGLETIETTGAQFDPHEHEAIMRLETSEHEDNTIVQEFQRGYKFKGRLLRPSMVQVAVKQ